MMIKCMFLDWPYHVWFIFNDCRIADGDAYRHSQLDIFNIHDADVRQTVDIIIDAKVSSKYYSYLSDYSIKSYILLIVITPHPSRLR